jgi:N-acetylneuraminic acid mutarotase
MTAEVWSERTGRWKLIAPLPEPLGEPAAAVVGKRVFVVGGAGIEDAHGYVYDPKLKSWSTIPQMPTPRYGLTAVAARDGRIYAIGGFVIGGNASAAVEAYDPSSGQWTERAPLPSPRVWFAATLGSDGRIYAIGGCGGCAPVLNALDIYDPATNQWTSGPPLPVASYAGAAVTARDGRIWYVDGLPWSGAKGLTWIFDPRSGAWSAGPPDPQPHEWLGAAITKDGTLVTVGGLLPDQGQALPLVETIATS